MDAGSPAADRSETPAWSVRDPRDQEPGRATDRRPGVHRSRPRRPRSPRLRRWPGREPCADDGHPRSRARDRAARWCRPAPGRTGGRPRSSYPAFSRTPTLKSHRRGADKRKTSPRLPGSGVMRSIFVICCAAVAASAVACASDKANPMRPDGVVPRSSTSAITLSGSATAAYPSVWSDDNGTTVTRNPFTLA